MDSETNRLEFLGGQCVLIERFLEKSRADHYFARIREQAQWSQPIIRLFGKDIPSPRLSAWYGDKSAIYRYSGLYCDPLPWFDELFELRQLLQNYTNQSFNSVLLNLYRDGHDSMGRHSDNEPELGEDPCIASISLGQTRRFVFKHKHKKNCPPVSIHLEHGSLFLMGGETQRSWNHSLPKTTKSISSRISLTYRWIEPEYHSVSRSGKSSD
ncbi:MAG: alpha-ketoglutarate-dependent dioxygenase AlkB [Gammaproteobacteria bacterium]|nr:alpha-ketoglutarate-dependent dioxygenase AlkB [Gammaproteobacteria bacterium]